MARVIHATTMKPTIANPCLVTGSSGNGANHTASGTKMQRICPTMTTGALGFSSKFSADADARAVSAATMGYSRRPMLGLHSNDQKVPYLSAPHRRRQVMMPADLERLHIDHISDEMRAV